jgi:hypothetical protein
VKRTAEIQPQNSLANRRALHDDRLETLSSFAEQSHLFLSGPILIYF